jgi:hypothetical protein
MYEALEKLPVEIIQDFRKTGRSLAIPDDVQKYIIQIDRAIEIYRFEPNVYRAARQLKTEFTKDDISFKTAQSRIYDAINYFNLNSTVKNESWDNYYADKLEDLALLAIKDHNWNQARLCFREANMLRTKHNDDRINPDDIKMKDFITSPDITPERLDIAPVNLRDLQIRDKFELYRKGKKLISDFHDISTEERKSIQDDLDLATGITDADPC